MSVRLRPTRHFRPSETGNLNSWNIDLMVRTSRLAIYTRSDLWKMQLYGITFRKTRKWKTGASMVECATQNIFAQRDHKNGRTGRLCRKLYRTILYFHITFFIYESRHIATISWLNIQVRLQSFRTRFIKNRSPEKELHYHLACNIHPS